jgi:hypothetical protein
MNDRRASPVLDLSECEQRVKDLEACLVPLSPSQRESATALQERIWAALWATTEDRSRAQGQVVRLEWLIAAGTVARVASWVGR